MLSSFDITRILAEASGDIKDGEIIGLEYYRKERALQIYIKSDRRYSITFSFHPQRSGFFILPAGRSKLDTREKHRPFARELTGGKIVSINQTPNDRIIEISIDANGKNLFLVLELIGPNGNAIYLDETKTVIASLRNKKPIEGKPYQPMSLPDKLDAKLATPQTIETLLAENSDTEPTRLIEKNFYGFDYYLAKTIISLGCDADSISKSILDIVGRYNSLDGPIFAYRIKGKTVFYPIKIAGFEPVEKLKSLSMGQRDIIIDSKADDEEASYHDLTVSHVKKRLKKSERLRKKLVADIDEAANYERYLQFADLLKIHLAKLKRGMESITVPDLYNDSSEIKIPLDKKLTGPENIERYSKRYRKGKEGLELLTRRQENVEREIIFLAEALDSFENNFEQAQSYYPELLPTIANGKPTASTTRKPYKEYQTSTGVTVLVGKTGSDNDRTTFDYARPYELWFHASQCPGSHVVMKYPHKNFEPSKKEIAEAAAAAAWASKARGSSKVPVSYTQKKYVRKPRKAKPGLVTIEREKTILVEPKELS
ncbi:MAG: DUF814 domain-containing protein [candidate division Zixibacteria bacterium]|nr:DUF814 domain-containing protein [candidate division Zixibacteria bacterium]